MKIKQTLDSTAEATVISENNQNAEQGGDDMQSLNSMKVT